MEQWKWVIGYEGLYEVSSLGRVRSVERRAPLRAGYQSGTRTVRERILANALVGHAKWGGYHAAHLCKGGVRRLRYVHRLVVSAFVRPLGRKEQINHLNGIKTDNRLENLEVVDSLGNIRHALATGLRDGRGEQNHKAVLQPGDVRIIRERIAMGHTLGLIADEYGVQRACISKIKHGRNWTHLS